MPSSTRSCTWSRRSSHRPRPAASRCAATGNRSLAASDDLAAQVDELQYGADEGPCLEALRAGTVVQVNDLSGDQRWPAYRPHAIAHGVASSLSLPLIVDGERLGALNLYATSPEAFNGPNRQQAEAFAAQCTAALTVSLRQLRQAQLHNQLAEAMVSSSVIDQAIGILMSQQRCAPAVAFDLLRQASQHRNRKLRDIAAEIVTRASGEPPQTRPGFVTGPRTMAAGDDTVE